MKFIVYLLTLFMVGTAVAQNPTILQGNYITNVFGQSNFVLNPNARTDVLNVTNATRSTTTPLVATSEFTLSLTSGTNATWTLRAFDSGMKGQNCEARFTYRGFATATTKAELVQNSLVVASLTLTPSTDPRIASINFPCGDLTNLTTFRIAQTTANMTGTNEIGGIYVGLATNQANVAQATMVGGAKYSGTNQASVTATTYSPLVNSLSGTITPSGVVTTAANTFSMTTSPLPPGDYFVNFQVLSYLNNSSTSQICYFAIQETTSNITVFSNYVRNDGTVATFPSSGPVQARFSFSDTAARTFRIVAKGASAGTTCSVVVDTSTGDSYASIYRFPTSSELVVTPERQNTWGSVNYTGTAGSLTVRSGQAASNTFDTFSGAAFTSARTLKGKCKAPVSGDNVGCQIENMPVGNYEVSISGLMFQDPGTTTVACSHRIFETTTSTQVASHTSSRIAAPGGLLYQSRTMKGVFNNTAVANRNFVIQAAKGFVADSSTQGQCLLFINTSGDISDVNVTVTPLDQPSNSALYVEGPVKASATGAAIPASYVGETFSVLGTTDATITTTSGVFSITLAQQTVSPGVWMLIPGFHCKENSGSSGSFRAGAVISTNPSASWSITAATTDGQVGLTMSVPGEFSQDLSGFPLFANVTSSTTYYLRATSFNNLASGSVICRGVLKGVRLN